MTFAKIFGTVTIYMYWGKNWAIADLRVREKIEGHMSFRLQFPSSGEVAVLQFRVDATTTQ